MFIELSSFGGSLATKCVSLNNQPCQARPTFIDVNSNVNVKVFNLMLGVNETRFLVQHQSCECNCRLNGNVRNSKQK